MLLRQNGLTVRISPDGCEAWIQFTREAEDHPASADLVLAALQQCGIVVEVDNSAVEKAIRTIPVPDPILVARGTHPVRGRDGWIEYRFDGPEEEPADNQDKRVDLRARTIIRNVHAGQVLAVVHQPGPGVPGISVTGKPIPAPTGHRVALRAGKNTAFDPENPAVLVARLDGHVERRADGSVIVVPVVIVSGNIDYSTGNIDFVGSLIIRGDVAGDFDVCARGSVRVQGSVGDAHVRAGGNVRIDRGFLGHGNGLVEAKGDVQVSHVVNQKIVAGRNVRIEKESVNATIVAGGSILAPTAVVAGGLLDAAEEIKIWSLGSSNQSQCRIKTGGRGRILSRLQEVEKELKLTGRQKDEMTNGLARLERAKRGGRSLREQQEAVETKLREALVALPARLAELAEERAILHAKLQRRSDARVSVLDTIHGNVIIEINGVRHVVEDALREVVFVERGGTIQAESL